MKVYLIRANHRGCEDSFILESENQYVALREVLRRMELVENDLRSIRINELSREHAVSWQYSELYAYVKKQDEKEARIVQGTKSYQLTEEQRKLIVTLLVKYAKSVDAPEFREVLGDDECNRLIKIARLANITLRQE